MNLSSPSYFVALLCLFFATIVTPLTAQTTAKVKKIPFHGKLSAVDTGAQTITLTGKKSTRVFHLTPTTKITDGAGNPSSLTSATVGEDVGGSYDKATMDLFSVRFGAKAGSKAAASEDSAPAEAPAPAAAAAPAPAAAAPAPATAEAAPAAAAPEKKKRFSGKLTSVDAAGGSIVVHGLTISTAGAKITDATGAAATLADFAAGDKVSGSYTPSGDGKTGTAASLKKSK